MVSHVLFTDGSVNPQQRLGVGVCLLLPAAFLESSLSEPDLNELAMRCQYRRFTDTSSTQLELQTLLWGVSIYREQIAPVERGGLRLYTDSQCIVGLAGRRERLEKHGFSAVHSRRPLSNSALYRAFFAAGDELGFEVVKLAGHCRTAAQDNVQQIFAAVDRCARRELGRWLAE
ncbi:ribonuclease H [Geobacter pelophilus]|uniref:Ribonuclease H n=1 Tax=Geoanaerobacter pelophilus TaxID=60036 RepID=A0AAW4L8K6_9BACT|nr:ribonuclease H [Geoanaerobacter pelophilus]MBT0665877.1 ribonuclease H [Geoanaerobacter pelophilus]